MIDQLRRSNAALRGQITKLKKNQVHSVTWLRCMEEGFWFWKCECGHVPEYHASKIGHPFCPECGGKVEIEI